MIYLLASLVGLSLGLLGGGGSVLAVPILVYGAGLPAKEAIASSLVVVGVGALLGAVAGHRRGVLDHAQALKFSFFSMFGTYGGSQLAHLLSDTHQMRLFGGVVLVVSTLMLRGRMARLKLPLPAAAVLVGLLTGLVGVGGGFLIVPALVLAAGLDMDRAVPTSLAVISFNSAAGLVGYLGGVSLQPVFLTGFTAAVLAGTWLGSRLSQRLSAAHLQKAFAFFLLAIGMGIVFQGGTV